MRRAILAVLAAPLCAGCLHASAVTRGAARLRGAVTPAARSIARGSRRVIRAAGQAADDAALAAKVRAVLMIRKGLEVREVHVGADEGVVHLTGYAANAAQKHVAGETVRRVQGVAGVVNQLVVRRKS